MQVNAINADDAARPGRGYSQAVEVIGVQRTVYVSGQAGVDLEGRVPAEFEAQARLVWRNIGAQLAVAGMGFESLMKLTVILTDRADMPAHGAIRAEVLGEHKPASTLLIAGLADPAWKIEIEGVAHA